MVDSGIGSHTPCFVGGNSWVDIRWGHSQLRHRVPFTIFCWSRLLSRRMVRVNYGIGSHTPCLFVYLWIQSLAISGIAEEKPAKKLFLPYHFDFFDKIPALPCTEFLLKNVKPGEKWSRRGKQWASPCPCPRGRGTSCSPRVPRAWHVLEIEKNVHLLITWIYSTRFYYNATVNVIVHVLKLTTIFFIFWHVLLL